MKSKIYIRIGQKKKGGLVAAASCRPNYNTLTGTPHYGITPVLPTLAFAIELEFPDALLKQAEQVAAKINLAKKGVTVCGKVLTPATVR